MSTIMKQIFAMSKILGYLGYKTDQSKNFLSKILFLKFERTLPHIKLGEGRKYGFPYQYGHSHGGHSCCNKSFQIIELMMQMKIVITLYVYLFLRQLIKNISIALTVFLKNAKAPKKIAFCIESKVEFLGKLNVKTWEDSTSSL